MIRYNVEFTELAEEGIKKHKKAGNTILVKKIFTLISEIEINPRVGTGKPEQLKGYDMETWSRRIDSKHRLLYEIHENRLMVFAISTYGHYDDK